MKKRIFLIVLDSFGIGEAPDADLFGDKGSNTLASISHSKKFKADTLAKLGLFNIDGVNCKEPLKNIDGAFGRFQELSKGKDTTAGHWEIAGLVSEKKFPTYPNGFPKEIIDKFKEATGREVLCNSTYSGTKVIADYGEEHIRTGALIVYTSADSVFQIAAHEDVVPVELLYDYCKKAREILCGEHAVGRVIARPFIGSAKDGFTRTSNRHDFSLVPPKDTILNVLQKNGYDTLSVGKIKDIFANSGISEYIYTKGNKDGMKKTEQYFEKDFNGLCFVNLVDFDMLYGHRNDVDGYANATAEFDEWLSSFIPRLRKDDILMITADHGCDPGTESTDHSREYIPLLIYGNCIKKNKNLGTRKGFCDIGKTIADIFEIENSLDGISFKSKIME
ncbi:MAG: phosphopentomutase [Clostridiales bacterium]|nr:phosphopentomutase [Clostridiales bacterium]